MSSTTIRIPALPYRSDREVYRGDTHTIAFVIEEGTATSSTPLNLAGWVFTCKVRDIDDAVVFSYTEGSGITVVDVDGSVTVTMPPTDTDGLVSGCCYKYDIQGIRSSDSYTKTYMAGNLNVSKDTTY